MSVANSLLEPILDRVLQRKTILILMSEGGGGHKVASAAMKEILSPYYDVEIVSALPHIIHQLDYFTMVTGGSFTGDDFYNFLLQRGYHQAVSLLARMGLKYMVAKRHQIDKLFQRFLAKSSIKYDMVISTFPYVNCGLALAAQKLNLPFLVMPTDLDTATFFCGLSELDFSKGGHLAFALPYDDQDLIKKAFRHFSLPKDKVHITGFPVRKECLRRYTKEQTQLMQFKHGLRLDSVILTLLLGAAGSELLHTYAMELFRIDPSCYRSPLEVNVCVGRYEKMKIKIQETMISMGGKILRENRYYTTVKSPQGVLFHLRGYMKEMVEIMVCSSLMITKTGSCTVNEAIYLGKRLLLDNTESSSARYLQWENFNVPFVRKHGLGDAFTELKELNPMIHFLLQEDLGHPVLSGAFTLPAFDTKLLELVSQMLL
ncbi:MAG: glycosyltransferase [Chlamydiae bacterium]|nr:glycosyltransferase [Chlamydiota bacterium]